MSQNVNPISLRLGIKQGWFLKYVAKKNNQSKNTVYNAIQVYNFLKLFLERHNLNLKNCNVYQKKNSTHLYIAYNYFIKSKIFKRFRLTKSNELVYLKKLQKKTINLSTFFEKRYNFKYRSLKFYLKFVYFSLKKNKKYTKIFTNCFKLKKYFSMSSSKTFLFSKFLNTFKLKRFNYLNLFFKKLLFILDSFFKNNNNLTIILKQLNKNNIINLDQPRKFKLVTALINLKKFQQIDSFKFGVNLIFNSLHKKSYFASLISNFAAVHLTKLKNLKSLNFFFKFLLNKIKNFLTIFDQIKTVELKVKGNLSKAQRSSKKALIVGKKFSKLFIGQNLQFCQSVAYTKKGTFGISVWVL